MKPATLYSYLPIVAARMPLNQAAQAHELLAGGSVKGKIVLICND
jgi:NADPH:quinone reductase-like Zn-dependent oxidoreductase